MTPEEINRAIAEACGWKQGRHFEQILTTGEGEWWDTWIHPTTEEELYFQPYDYYNDLNAMREARKSLTEQQRYDYGEGLFAATGGSYGPDGENEDSMSKWKISDATANQHAEVFVRVVGKWRDS